MDHITDYRMKPLTAMNKFTWKYMQFKKRIRVNPKYEDRERIKE